MLHVWKAQRNKKRNVQIAGTLDAKQKHTAIVGITRSLQHNVQRSLEYCFDFRQQTR